MRRATESGTRRALRAPRTVRAAAWIGGAVGGTLVVLGAAFAEVPAVTAPVENPVTESKRVLGKILFWDEQLSADDTVACGTCHVPARGGTDPRLGAHPGADGTFGTADDVVGSPGVLRADAAGAYEKDATFALTPQVTGRAAPPAIMAQYADLLFWDGRATGAFRDPVTDALHIASGGALESQVVGPPVSSVEMAHAARDWGQITTKLETAVPLVLATNVPQDAADAIAARGSYPALFAAAFGDAAITPRRIAFAIATYERTLIADQTPWDRFRAGDVNALTDAALRGWNAFQAPAHRCNVCHEPPLFTDDTFRNIGVRPVAEDTGRQAITGSSADRGKFKVPGLRNVGLKRTFMHQGEFTSLADVLRFYAQAPGTQQFTDNQDPLIPPIRVPPQAQADIVAFLTTGLTDPRVAAETFPFDRPTLHSERTPNPLLTGAGSTGTGGRTPRMVAVTPPRLGNALFQLAVDNALPGATAELVRSSSAPSGGVVAQDEVVATLTLGGSGAGDGHATALWPVPADAARFGEVHWFQWRVADPAATGGVALSRIAQVTLEGAVLAEPEEPEEPEPVPVASDDGALYVASAAFAIDWKAHARGASSDTFELRAVLNPRGADDAFGAHVTLTLGGVELLETSGLNARGIGSGTTSEGVAFKASYSASTGALVLRAKGLDLRAATGLADETASGALPLALGVRIDGIDLATPEAAQDLEFAYASRAGDTTRAAFAFAKQRSLDAVFAALKTKAKRRANGAHVVSVKGPLVLADGADAFPAGDVSLVLGDADPLVVPLAALVRVERGGATGFSYDRRAAAVAGLKSLKYDPKTRVLSIVTTELADLGLPATGALEADVDVRVIVPLASGASAYETVVRLHRKSGAAATWSR